MTTLAAGLLLAALAQTPEKAPAAAAPGEQQSAPTQAPQSRENAGTATAPGEQQSSPKGTTPQTPRERALAQATDQAKKDIDFAAIHLQAAKLYLTGLYGLEGRPSTWDREHGVALFTHAQDALTDAQRQLAELQGFAPATWPGARDPLNKVRRSLERVQTQLRSLSVPLHPSAAGPEAGQSTIKDMYKQLDAAHGDLESAAHAMGVDAKLRKP
jgi:hypothetical protein